MSDGKFDEIEITPEDAGLSRAAPHAISGGAPDENAARLKALLDGQGQRAERDIVCLNAGALLLTAGAASSLREGADMAHDAISGGGAARVLAAYVEATNA